MTAITLYERVIDSLGVLLQEAIVVVFVGMTGDCL